MATRSFARKKVPIPAAPRFDPFIQANAPRARFRPTQRHGGQILAPRRDRINRSLSRLRAGCSRLEQYRLD